MEPVFLIIYILTHMFVISTVCYYMIRNNVCCCYRYDQPQDSIELGEDAQYTVSTPRTICSENNSVYSHV